MVGFIFSFLWLGLNNGAWIVPLIIVAPLVFALVVVSIAINKNSHILSQQGITTVGKILGFEAFLQLTEADKLKLLDAPDLQPEMFEKFLPYAMVLGVEKEWAKKFEGIYTTMPAWYEDPTVSTMNSYILAQNLGGFNGSFNKVWNIASAPSGSSGFGGGGFSGGGFGGGGGGSW
jgi:uncharacterized membrane protein